jgi:hypothetical protein
MFGIVFFEHHLKDGVKKHRRIIKMAYVGIGTKSISGIVCDPECTFINVSDTQKSIDLCDPITSDYAHYLVHHFIRLNHFRHHRHVDNSIELESHHAQAFLSFASKEQLELDNLTKRSYELDQAQSHEIEVHDREKFDEYLHRVTVHKSNIEKADRYIDSLKVQLYEATGTSQGIVGVTKASIASTKAFSEAKAKRDFSTQHKGCIEESTVRKLDVKYKRTYTLEARKFEAPTVDNLGESIIATRLIRLIHEDYFHHQNIIEMSKNVMAVEEMYLKIAIGQAGSMRGVFSYKIPTSKKLNTEKFRALPGDLYEKCKVTSEPKWKCEILPFRG